MKYYIIAGEASGDLHGSNLMKAINLEDPSADIRFWGGEKMAAQGGTIVKDYKELAFMGFWEVLINLKTILNNLAFCKKDILRFQPDVLVYIDYPGFNMRIAQWAKKQGIPNHYYISPQIWAWKENRIKKIKRDLDALYVILPFEAPYFKEKHHYDVTFVGHPLTQVIQEERQEKETLTHYIKDNDKPIIALLPGSRKQEINKVMPVFLSVIDRFPHYHFVIAGAPGIDPQWYQKFTLHPSVSLLHNQTYALLKNAYAAIVTSGTATLETALFGVPQMVCYKSSGLSYAIAKRIVKLEYISLVNLILQKEVVKELIQEDCTHEMITSTLTSLGEEKVRKQIENDYLGLTKLLGEKNASQEVAQAIITDLQ
ncbi:MAG: lipid-A-disaccharide synthase [Flavobacteriaceae bacterium]|nr:lipid-A-disaccharide synthase [Flavobacteriaceae bacterium]